MNKKYYLFLVGVLFLFMVVSLISALGERTFCAERTKSGAWCQNVPEDQINTAYKQAPSSCDQTSFCKLGTCINSQEGSCLPNVPQRVCENNNGVWAQGNPSEIPQCRLGCCLGGGGEVASFVTQTRCRALAGTYGIETEFRGDITSELECSAYANPQEKGACIVEDEFNSRECRMSTRAECLELESSSQEGVEFHAGFLCSAEALATNCGIPKNPQTTCVENKDEVYFLDSCGNLANIYDASRKSDPEYWTKIIEKENSCGASSTNGNAKSNSCGNCDYLSGSTCKQYERGNSATVDPIYGEYVCADLGCNYNGQKYKHGESWCGESKDLNSSLPGSESFRLVCWSGEVIQEACSPFRSEICVNDPIETDEGIFRAGSCEVNRWHDCILQDSKEKCEDLQERDCQWINGTSILGNEETGQYFVQNAEEELVDRDSPNIDFDIDGFIDFDDRKGAACVPKNAPGFDFWMETGESAGQAEEVCAVINRDCIIRAEKRPGGPWRCQQNCECIGMSPGERTARNPNVEKTLENLRYMCSAVGDCGNKKNYIGVNGYEIDDWEVKVDVNVE